MKIYLYNTLSGKKELLPKPRRGWLGFFVCGPTVYDHSHIGHARTYLVFDSLVRYLRSLGVKITYLQNVTDVDDKIIDRARREKKNPIKLADSLYKEYREDMKDLGVVSVSRYALASGYIREIQDQISRLIKKGFAYKTEKGVYFEVRKFSDYGKLSRQNLDELRPGYRIEPDSEKRDPLDFALWKFPRRGLTQTGLSDLAPGKRGLTRREPVIMDGEPMWPAAWGLGRPGWHIEDTAIAEKIFGLNYELHGGGMELKFPHHEAEIAQARALSGKKNFVKVWLHSGLLLVDGEKMAKSLGNFITIRNFLKKYPAEVLRLLVLIHHYRSPLNYADRLAWETRKNWEGLKEFLAKLAMIKQRSGIRRKAANKNKQFQRLAVMAKNFYEALADDFNTSAAMAAIFGFIKQTQPTVWNLSPPDASRVYNEIIKILKMFGFQIEFPSAPRKARQLAEEREKLRHNQQFIQADSLRKKINSLGWVVEDTPLGPFMWPRG